MQLAAALAVRFSTTTDDTRHCKVSQHRPCHIQKRHNLAEQELHSEIKCHAERTPGTRHEKAPATTGQATKVMEQSTLAASKGAADFNFHLLDITQANMNAAFDFARQAARITSLSEFFELSAAYSPKRIQALTERTNLTQLAKKVTDQAAQSLQAVAKTIQPKQLNSLSDLKP